MLVRVAVTSPDRATVPLKVNGRGVSGLAMVPVGVSMKLSPVCGPVMRRLCPSRDWATSPAAAPMPGPVLAEWTANCALSVFVADRVTRPGGAGGAGGCGGGRGGFMPRATPPGGLAGSGAHALVTDACWP